MADKPQNNTPTPDGIPAFLVPITRAWARTSGRLVPVFAVVSAFLLGIPLLIISAGEWNVGKGLEVARSAYSSLVEGATGLAVNDVMSADGFDVLRTYADQTEIEARGFKRQADRFANVAEIGTDTLKDYETFFAEYPVFADYDDDTMTDTADRIHFLRDDVDDLDAFRDAGSTLQLLETLDAGSRETDALVALFAGDATQSDFAEIATAAESASQDEDAFDAEIERIEALVDAGTALEASDQTLLLLDGSTTDPAFWNTFAEMDDDTFRDTRDDLAIISPIGLVAAQRNYAVLDLLDGLDVGIYDDPADTILDIADISLSDVQDGIATLNELTELDIDDPAALNAQLRRIGGLYDAGYMQTETVNAGLEGELTQILDDNLVIQRPGQLFPILVDEGAGSNTVGIVDDDQDTPIAYLRLGSTVILFIPANLEATLVRAIPFIIAGLAVALGFKAGLFNIGAEGQIYAGALLVAWLGVALNLPAIIHLPIIIVVGIIGGFFYGAIPGALKAYTGAHEVITTIMLNFIAIRFVDWIIKSKDPLLLGDPDSSVPRTKFLEESARMPTFDTYSPIVFIVAGVVIFLLLFWGRRNRPMAFVRPLIAAVIVVVGGFFLKTISVNGDLHLGFVLMLLAVWFVDWFLDRTTPGFELRTVGTNPDAANYAGMSVKWNILLAMALSGALAGYAGMIEVSGKEFHMKPAFVAGVGFDAIAVALIARTNPRTMIWAGLLWGGLLSGANLMQSRAGISIDLVKIVQALIIMFIAADQIIRFLWRVPKRTAEDGELIFSKGWGG